MCWWFPSNWLVCDEFSTSHCPIADGTMSRCQNGGLLFSLRALCDISTHNQYNRRHYVHQKSHAMFFTRFSFVWHNRYTWTQIDGYFSAAKSSSDWNETTLCGFIGDFVILFILVKATCSLNDGLLFFFACVNFSHPSFFFHIHMYIAYYISLYE